MNMVIVDNDKSFLRSLEILLLHAGHDVVCFADPCKAEEYLRTAGKVDRILLDYLMPECNGDELITRIRAHLPVHCRVALISGFIDSIPDEVRQTLEVDAVYTKPLDISKLMQFVQATKT